MPGALELAGAARDPSSFAALHTDRLFTGFWPNRSVLRDGASTIYMLRYGLGRQDTILAGRNLEISPFLTLIRRYGSSRYSDAAINPVFRFYSFNTFTLTDEIIRVMADTATTVYDFTTSDDTVAVLFQKSANAVGHPTFFLGVGNTLYFTNGVDNMQATYTDGSWSVPIRWGFDGPTTKPTVAQSLRPNPYFSWMPSTAYCVATLQNIPLIAIVDTNNNIQFFHGTAGKTDGGGGGPHPIKPNPPSPNGITGAAEPNPWNTTGTTIDNTITWHYGGPADWIANNGHSAWDIIAADVTTSLGVVKMFFQSITTGGIYLTGPTPPKWPSAIGAEIQDNQVTWQNIGNALTWAENLGPSCPIVGAIEILDTNGFAQLVIGAGKTSAGPQPPNFSTTLSGVTYDGTAIWQNQGPFAVAANDVLYYGYAYENSTTVDVSNMSPPSDPILVILGNEVTIQGVGTGQPGIDQIPIYRTLQGGGDFFLKDTIPNPGAGVTWTYVDTDITVDGVNQNIIAQVVGEGTPLPPGATCLAYHLGRIFAAVGNVVYVSSGPDAVNSGSSGNAGFDQFFTLQSKITRFWVTSAGLIVFTVRDSYVFLGSATDTDPLYVQVYIPQLPLLHYDCFTEFMGTGYLYLGTRMVVALNPGSGITEVSFPVANYIANVANGYDPASSFLTFHSTGSSDTALYLANGTSEWLRMALTTTPESGSAWNPPAIFPNGTSAVQSVEVTPGIFNLLIAPRSQNPILKRDHTFTNDNGATFSCHATFGSIAMTDPGQLAGIAWMTLTSTTAGSPPDLSMLIGEISGPFEEVPRTRQDPPDLPLASSIRSDRHHLLQSQNPVWCRHFQFALDWPAENAFNELLSFTIVGQVVQELKGS